MSTDYKERPIFISGVAKSGTSMLLSLIDGHNKILSYPEEPSFHKVISRSYPTLERLVRDWVECYSVLGVRKNILLNRMLKKGFKYVREYPDFVEEDISQFSEEDYESRLQGVKVLPSIIKKYEETLRTELESISIKKDIMLSSIKAVASALGADVNTLEFWSYKETFNKNSAHKVEYLFESFNEPNVLFITRDPRSWYNSRKTSHIKQGQYKRYNGLIYPAMMLDNMKKSHGLFLELQNKYGKDNIYITRYEDLVKNTMNEVDRIFNFLELETQDINYYPSKLGYQLNVHTSPESTDGSKIFNKSLDKWESGLSIYDKINIYLFAGSYYLFNKFDYNY